MANNIVVDIGVKLSSASMKSLETEIRQAVMNAVAKEDQRGDLVIKKLRPGTYGIWIGKPSDIGTGRKSSL